jgi:hypothetical protein
MENEGKIESMSGDASEDEKTDARCPRTLPQPDRYRDLTEDCQNLYLNKNFVLKDNSLFSGKIL